MAGSIRLLFEPQAQQENGRRVVLGGTLRLLTMGAGASRAKLDEPQSAVLTFHAAHLERARNAKPEFEPFAKLAGQVMLKGAERKPVFSFQPDAAIEYLSAASEDRPPARVALRYATSDFENPPAPDSELCRLNLPPTPANARFLELGVELEIDGGTEAALERNDRLDLALALHLSLPEVTPHFAPGAEIFPGGSTEPAPGERCRIGYRIVDAIHQISSAWFEVSRKRSPTEVLAHLPLEPGAWSPGEHTFEWDGLCTEGDWEGRFLTVLGSPYEVRLVAETPSGRKVARSKTEVLLGELQLDRAPYLSPDEEPPAEGSAAHYQHALTELGFHTGPIDGSIGDKSKRAIKDFQRSHAGLKPSGALDAATKAYLDGVALPGTGLDHYQFILNYIGYRAGVIDGLSGPNTRRAVGLYREDHGLGVGDALDGPTKAALDAEALEPLKRREVLEGDLNVADVSKNALPAPGTQKKLFTYCDSSISPGHLPFRQKYGVEQKNLVRAHLPLQVKPLVLRSDGSTAFAPDAISGVRINFKVETTPPPADLGISNATTREFVASVMGRDGDEAQTGHHAHHNRGGVRKSDDPGTFLSGAGLVPYEANKNGVVYQVECITEPGAALGTAGVYLVPSTIAGDHLTVAAEVATEGFDQPPFGLRVATGTLVNHRRYHITSLWLMEYVPRPHRTTAEPELGLRPWFAPAFIEFVEPEAPNRIMVRPRAADPQNIDLPLYTAIIREANYSEALLSDADIQTRFENEILWPLRPAAIYNAANEQAYHDAITLEIDAFEERFSKALRTLSLLEGQDGIMVLVFHRNAPRAGTLGIHPVVNPHLQTWGWSVLASEGAVHLIDDQDAGTPGAIDGETLAHELGHALWLHHATTEAGSLPHPSHQGEHHPPEYETCTMSYVTLANFCGKCVLKLRGWDEAKL